MALRDTSEYLAALEADRNNEGKPTGTTSKVRRALFAGEWLSGVAVGRRFKCSSSLLNVTMRDMRGLGFEFEQQRTDAGLTAYRLRNPKHPVNAADVRRMRASRPRRPVEPVEPGVVDVDNGERPRRRSKPYLPVLPAMGSALTVTMLSIDPDTGLARMGLRNGAHAYEVTVDAQT